MKIAFLPLLVSLAACRASASSHEPVEKPPSGAPFLYRAVVRDVPDQAHAVVLNVDLPVDISGSSIVNVRASKLEGNALTELPVLDGRPVHSPGQFSIENTTGKPIELVIRFEVVGPAEKGVLEAALTKATSARVDGKPWNGLQASLSALR